MYKNLVDFTKKLYKNSENLPLHEPFFEDTNAFEYLKNHLEGYVCTF